MPRKPDKQCATPGCPELVPAGQAKCKRHRAKDNRHYERTRDKAVKKRYSEKAWRQLRELKLAQDPCCERCLAKGQTEAASIAHHKEYVTDGGNFLPELTDLESICVKCHNKEHKRGAVKGKNA